MLHINFWLLNIIIGAFSIVVALFIQSVVRYASSHVKINQNILSKLPFFCAVITFACSMVLNYFYNFPVK